MNTDSRADERIVMNRRRVAVLLLACAAAAATHRLTAQTPPGRSISISFTAAARAEPVTGMVYLALSRDNRTTPIQQTDPEGVPLFSKYVEQLQPGTPVTFDTGYRGHPLAALRDI